MDCFSFTPADLAQKLYFYPTWCGHTEIAKLVKASDELLQYALNLDGERVAAAIEKYKK